ncbi:hypothetical protein TraAM80_03178 [Trypanosoma rangeli]|uniref:Uncharacterized protein n=1 Tax=Trypanosoma rangeli TaxID=5698 RepID=A0A3R7NK80_TRYRA|nr:uncharacterized protein TraAM80_03178 [Trypanosoma rangeli]RNF07731.1 hypothetical protein TraAM80_03178 [Trypanosoma rangeli]|eukprot:RNF07731.1 hypothetical protein TraAM80_03178 [Trypanosoma rangeli]
MSFPAFLLKMFMKMADRFEDPCLRFLPSDVQRCICDVPLWTLLRRHLRSCFRCTCHYYLALLNDLEAARTDAPQLVLVVPGNVVTLTNAVSANHYTATTAVCFAAEDPKFSNEVSQSWYWQYFVLDGTCH